MDDGWIPLNDPDMSLAEIDAVSAVLKSSRLSAGPQVEAFEDEFADYVGRRYGIAVASGTLGLMLGLRAMGIGPGDEVIASAYGWHQIAHAIVLAGATPVFAEIDYWSGCLAPDKAAQKIGPKTRAIVAGNSNGHPAAWNEFRQLAAIHGLKLIEDSTEAIGSRYQGRLVGSFGDLAIFDFSQPSALCCGEGGMIVTDDPELASELRYLRSRALDERFSISIANRVPAQAGVSDLTAALGLAQLQRIDEILARRKKVESYYLAQIQSFEGIKPPYLAPEIDEIHWLLFLVHLGTRFTKSARNQIVDDLATESIEAAAFCYPLHQQYFYTTLGYKRGDLKVTEKIADRALALPFHAHLAEDQVRFIVQTAKDSSVNVGAGAAIY
ncbi:DegT/DnrJ/EryC1/StrS aminotransferase family protein [Azoarcus sp. KH32C]|uniref:DegT/DnrJ/EryC1/StrS family aminotransferase n=1 Tax=Azoarcus sp. KH32C TaxID=748247 RepID=UPI000238667A|nr:DegT/DnrJ/EryC1/StrS family aminotransferase [Azoarcus sp. KH32C]BAL26350.1 DegT/DnrJ/EryC1/StrS aminotransferase [Azoarcus sp. KH32C]